MYNEKKVQKSDISTDVNNILDQIHSGCEYCLHEMDFIEVSFDLIEDACKSYGIKWNKPKKSIN